MAADTYERYFQDGTAAFERGLSRTRCPHAPGTREHRLWSDGWSFAERQTDEEIRLMLKELRSEVVGLSPHRT